MKLSKETFQKTSLWIKRNARPLESARWDYLIEGTSGDQVIDILSAYQNADGGFGHGVEPDFWSPHSSPMATWAAGRILMETETDSNESIVKGMISYLVDSYPSELGLWHSVLPEHNQYAHAPWWHWKEGIQENWMFNPSVELAAYLIHWSPKQSKASKIGWSVIERAVAYLMNKDEMDMHEVGNFLEFTKIITPYEAEFHSKLTIKLNRVTDKIMLLAERCVEKDVSKWTTGYKALPLDFIDDPEHQLCNNLGILVDQNLELYLNQLSVSEVWDISWEWGDYPSEFSIARRYWQGILTVNRYKLLKSFGILE